MNEIKKETSAVTEESMTSGVAIDPVEFNKILDNAPKGSVTDKPLPLKPNIVSTESDDDRS